LNLSAVVGEALQRGLREEEQLLRRDSVLQQYRNAFAGFSQDELLLLDGVVMEDRTRPAKRETPATQREAKRRVRE